MADWYTAAEDDTEALKRIEAAWSDAPLENLEVLSRILGIAKRAVIAYGPTITPTEDADPAADPYPEGWEDAQLRHAVNLWNAGRTDGAGNVGTEGYSFQPRPLDKVIREIIRPTTLDFAPL